MTGGTPFGVLVGAVDDIDDDVGGIIRTAGTFEGLGADCGASVLLLVGVVDGTTIGAMVMLLFEMGASDVEM